MKIDTIYLDTRYLMRIEYRVSRRNKTNQERKADRGSGRQKGGYL